MALRCFERVNLVPVLQSYKGCRHQTQHCEETHPLMGVGATPRRVAPGQGGLCNRVWDEVIIQFTHSFWRRCQWSTSCVGIFTSGYPHKIAESLIFLKWFIDNVWFFVGEYFFRSSNILSDFGCISCIPILFPELIHSFSGYVLALCNHSRRFLCHLLMDYQRNLLFHHRWVWLRLNIW